MHKLKITNVQPEKKYSYLEDKGDQGCRVPEIRHELLTSLPPSQVLSIQDRNPRHSRKKEGHKQWGYDTQPLLSLKSWYSIYAYHNHVLLVMRTPHLCCYTHAIIISLVAFTFYFIISVQFISKVCILQLMDCTC